MRRVAAIDCGTNSLRLLVADLDLEQGVAFDVVRRSEIVRLGQGVDRTGTFAPEALARTFAVVEAYAEQLRGAGAEAVRFVATSAARDASNRDAFASGVQARLGVAPDIVTGDEEALLSYDGATRGIERRGGVPQPWVVLDIGGGSTELVGRLGESGPVRGQSLDIGAVRITERHLATDPPTAAEVARAAADIESALDALTLDLDEVGTLVGVAGTITTMVASALDLPSYQPDRIHHAWIDRATMERAVEHLVARTVAERRALGFMDPRRADVIGGGALVLRAVMRRLDVPGLLASEHDILDGIAWSMA